MALPIKNGKITTPFGIKGDKWSSGRHEGVDFAVPVGTDVLACSNGTVIEVGSPWGSAFGHHSVLVRHIMTVNGVNKVVYVIYAHCSKFLVKPGDKVTLGQHIAESGADGNVTGPHLHLEVQLTRYWKKGGGINPQPLLDKKA